MSISPYDLLSLGLYSGAEDELTNSDKDEYVRILSLGMLLTTITPEVGDKTSGGLNDVGTSTRL